MWWLIYWLERKPELLIVTDLLFFNINLNVVYQKKSSSFCFFIFSNTIYIKLGSLSRTNDECENVGGANKLKKT